MTVRRIVAALAGAGVLIGLAAPAQAQRWGQVDPHESDPTGDITYVHVDHAEHFAFVRVRVRDLSAYDTLTVFYDTRHNHNGPDFALTVDNTSDSGTTYQLWRVNGFHIHPLRDRTVHCRGIGASSPGAVYRTVVPQGCLASGGRVPTRIRVSVKVNESGVKGADWAPSWHRFSPWLVHA